MTRTKFRQTWMAVMVVMLLGTSYTYNKSQDVQVLVDRAKREKDRLEIERSTGNKMTTALSDLNSVTLNESQATKLEILRYLGIEQTDLTFTPKAPVKKQIGGTDVTLRLFELSGMLPYAAALDRLDLFHNVKKVSVYRVVMQPTKEYGDLVYFTMEGAIYGLEK